METLDNVQGDIIAILDSDGRVVVKYTYDAWGNTVTEVLDCNANAIAVTVVVVCVILPSLSPVFMNAISELSAKPKNLVSICTKTLNGLRLVPAL